MKAIQLYLADGIPIDAFLCGKCQAKHYSSSSADQCCVCDMCGVETEHHAIYCENCRLDYNSKLDRSLFDKAIKIPESEYDGAMVTDGDTFFSLKENYSEREYLWATTKHPFPKLDLDDYFERVNGECYDDASDSLDGVDEIQKAIDAFNERNSGAYYYTPDYSRAVVVAKADSETTFEPRNK